METLVFNKTPRLVNIELEHTNLIATLIGGIDNVRNLKSLSVFIDNKFIIDFIITEKESIDLLTSQNKYINDINYYLAADNWNLILRKWNRDNSLISNQEKEKIWGITDNNILIRQRIYNEMLITNKKEGAFIEAIVTAICYPFQGLSFKNIPTKNCELVNL